MLLRLVTLNPAEPFLLVGIQEQSVIGQELEVGVAMATLRRPSAGAEMKPQWMFQRRCVQMEGGSWCRRSQLSVRS